jgi:hypothetical protein
MSSEPELPLTKQYANAQNAIDNFRHYMLSIKDPDVRARFEAEVATRIANFRGPSVAAFRAVYEKYFPKGGGARGELAKPQQQAAANQVRPLKDEAEQLLASLKAWAATTGVKELTAESFDATIRVEGQRIWRESWVAAKAKVDGIVGGFNFQGKPVDYRGSTKKGERTAAKGKTHFDAADFDVDAFVVNEELFKKIVARRPDREQYGKIFPEASDETAPLLAIGSNLSVALRAAFPGVDRLRKVDVVLRRQKPMS